MKTHRQTQWEVRLGRFTHTDTDSEDTQADTVGVRLGRFTHTDTDSEDTQADTVGVRLGRFTHTQIQTVKTHRQTQWEVRLGRFTHTGTDSEDGSHPPTHRYILHTATPVPIHTYTLIRQVYAYDILKMS